MFKQGYIQNVLLSGTAGSGFITIQSNIGSFPFLSEDGSLSYIDNIIVGDTFLTGYSVVRTSSYDEIIVPIPSNITNNNLLVNTSYGNYLWNTPLQFSYLPITITGVTQYSGTTNVTLTISGTNFYRVSDVFFGGVDSVFQIIDPQTILAVTPTNGISAPINVFSNSWNETGVSSQVFFFQPQITYTSPVTGQWKDFINIGGTNFTGTTGVYFNKTPAYDWYLLSNDIISAQTPETGQPYPSGYIYIYGSGGTSRSLSVYNPVIPIYGFSPSSGNWGSGINVFLKIDTGYLYPFSGGYEAKIGGINTPLFISGNNSTGILTGIVPSGADADYIFIYGQDGITTFPTNNVFGILGSPVITSISPSTINLYSFYNYVLNGGNLQFFDNNSFLTFTSLASGNVQSFPSGDFTTQVGGNSLLVNNVSLTGSTGYYNVSLNNNRGTFTLNSGIYVNNPVNQNYKFGHYIINSFGFDLSVRSGDTLPIPAYAYCGGFEGYWNGLGWKLPSTNSTSVSEIILDNSNCPSSFFGYYNNYGYVPTTWTRNDTIYVTLYSANNLPALAYYYTSIPNNYIQIYGPLTLSPNLIISPPSTITGVNSIIIWSTNPAGSYSYLPYVGVNGFHDGGFGPDAGFTVY